jgi:hypothetical protein
MSTLENHITPYSKAIVRLLKSNVERNSNVWDDVISYQNEIQQEDLYQKQFQLYFFSAF